MAALPEYVVKLIKNIADTERFTNYQIETKAATSHEDGFIGHLIGVVISGTRTQNDGPPFADRLHLMCKLIPENVTRRTEFHTEQFFEREALMYSKILPFITTFQRGKHLKDDDCFVAYPKCYASVADAEQNQYAIIMEDLHVKGYAMWSKRVAPPVQQALTAVEELAKLHSVSFAVKDQRPELYAELKNVKDIYRVVIDGGLLALQSSTFKRAATVLDKAEHVKIAQSLDANIRDYLKDCLDDGAFEPFGALSHGDCWCNNQLYRYRNKATGEIDICFVDWQLSRFGSPALDILDVLCTTSDKEFLDNNYHNIVKHYHESLCKFVERLGTDPAKIFTLGELHNFLRKFGVYAMMVGIFTITVALPNAKDIPDLDGLNGSDNKDGIIIPFDDATQLLYKKRINEFVLALVELGFFNNYMKDIQ